MRLQAIILGSDTFPLMAANMSKVAFATSARDFCSYLSSATSGLAMCDEQILDLFASDDPIEQQDRVLTTFLETAPPDTDGILIYYVGHGGFLPDRQYYLAVKHTNPRRRHFTGLRIRDLAMTLSEYASGRRIYMILDCCFAGAATKEFQSDELSTLIEAQTFESLPEFGTALLVASSKDEPAISPDGNRHTMLAEALLETLRVGSPFKGDLMSLRDVAEQTAARIRAKWGHYAVRPEVHTPRQANGDIADHPFFPNPTPRSARQTGADTVFVSYYRSRDDRLPFGSWVAFRPSASPVSLSEVGFRYVDQKPSYSLQALGQEIVGANKYLDAVKGLVRFSYKIVEFTDKNIIFFVIPLIDGGYISPGRRKSPVEFGVSNEDDPANGFSLHRLREIPKQFESGGWQLGEIHFDFSQIENIRSSVFAPRLNEGTSKKGPGQVFFTDVNVFTYV